MNLFRKKTKRQKEINPIEKPIEKKRESLVLEHKGQKTSVFFHEKLIIKDTPQEPFIIVNVGEMEIKKGKEQNIQKKFPLKCVTAEKIEERIDMLFYAKGTEVKVSVKEAEGKILIKVKKREYGEIILSFPRGTNENISHVGCEKSGEKQKNNIFTTKISNFYSSEGFLYNLKTAKEWGMEFNKREKRIIIKGEKAKINIIYGETKEEILRKYNDDRLKDDKPKEKEIYITVDENNYKQKIEALIKKKVEFDGIIIKQNKAEELDDKVINYCKAKRKKIILAVKPYTHIKERIVELENHVVKDKQGKNYIQEIDGEKFYAINLARRESRRWLQNKLRKLMDKGVSGFVGEKGKIDSEKTNLPQEEKYSYGEVWYILWQKLLKEVVDEYPNKLLMLKDNGNASKRYGKVIVEKCSQIENSREDVEETRQKYRDCGMGDVIVEIGEQDKKAEKEEENILKWQRLIKQMPIVILTNMSEKATIRILEKTQ